MGNTPYSITLINIYDVGARFEYNEEALIDDRLYGIRRTPDHALEAVYMPGTPQERHLAESSVREVLYGVIMNEVNAQRWQRELAEQVERAVARRSKVTPAADSIVNSIISLLADLSVVGVNMKQATRLATVIANHEIGVTVGMELEARNPTPQGEPVEAPIAEEMIVRRFLAWLFGEKGTGYILDDSMHNIWDQRPITQVAFEAYFGHEDELKTKPQISEHHCAICGRSSRDTFLKEIPGGLWQCVDHHADDGE